MTDKLSIIPIGGLGEFGMNCMVMRYGDEIIVIDAGLMFPDANFFGVDIIVPDFKYLQEHKDKIQALILTHSHEDHIGAVPFLLKQINMPVYTTPYTAAVLYPKLEEHGLADEVLVHRVRPKDLIELGPFWIEFIRVSHSTTDCAALAITTPVGVVIHTGDFKFDETPVCGLPIDVESLRRYGDEGVLALLSDSTSIDRPGRMPSEREVIPALEGIFDKTRGRIIVSCFTSSIHRLQVIFSLAAEFGRKVGVLGRSMLRNIDTAETMRFLDIKDGITINPADTKRFRPHQVLLLVTGCQGEPMSALARMATNNHKQAKVEAGDTVILSARQIPGNEKTISRLINNLYRCQAQVVDSTSARIHVSGHGAQEDLRLMLEAVRPKLFIPIHGEYRQIYQHKQFACSMGYKPEQVILIENGDVIELTSDHAEITGKVELGRRYISGTDMDDIDDIIIRERKSLAYEGIVLPMVGLNKTTKQVTIPPNIVIRGFNIPHNREAYLGKIADLVTHTINTADVDEFKDESLLKEKIRVEIKRFINREIGGRPMIVPMIVEA